MLKRAFDVLAALTGLVLLSPALLAIAVAVRLDSPGPALFRQERVGRQGQAFQILKFRTMSDCSVAPGPLLTIGADRRITRVGAILRRSKLDELPQLWNVLVGDMSLVGPRPEVPRYVEYYPPQLRETVLSVRPGITDEAAIRYADESALLATYADPEAAYVGEILPRKLELYVDYVQHRSFTGDLRILGRTFARLIRRPSA